MRSSSSSPLSSTLSPYSGGTGSEHSGDPSLCSGGNTPCYIELEIGDGEEEDVLGPLTE